jgi:DNA-binding NarL/FixJ family response regulator
LTPIGAKRRRESNTDFSGADHRRTAWVLDNSMISSDMQKERIVGPKFLVDKGIGGGVPFVLYCFWAGICMERMADKRLAEGWDKSNSNPVAAAAAIGTEPQVGRITVGRVAPPALRRDFIGTKEDGPCSHDLSLPSRNRVFPAAAPPPSDFPARVHIALLAEDENTRLALRQMIQSCAPQWTLQVIPDSHLSSTEAWTSAVTRASRSKGGPPANDKRPVVLVIAVGPAEDRLVGHIGILVTLLPSAPILVLAARLNAPSVIESLAAGAAGYALNTLALTELAKIIRSLAEGQPALCPEAQRVVLDYLCWAHNPQAIEALTKREREVILWTAQGLIDKEIADRMGITPNTVHVHLVRLFRKLGARNRREAAQKFLGLTGAANRRITL